MIPAPSGGPKSLLIFASPYCKYQLLFRTLDSLIQQNEDVDKTITYLKMDVEGYELDCFENWFSTNVFDNVEQFGIEILLLQSCNR